MDPAQSTADVAAMRKAATAARQQLGMGDAQAADHAAQQPAGAPAASGPAINVAVHRTPEVRRWCMTALCQADRTHARCKTLCCIVHHKSSWSSGAARARLSEAVLPYGLQSTA